MNCKRTIAVLLAVAATASLTGCGNKPAASSAAVSTASKAASSAAAAVPTAKLTLALDPSTPAPLLGGLYAADKQGYFTQCGLTVTFCRTNTAERALELLSSGEAQLSTTTQSGACAQALSDKKAVTAVAALLQHSDEGILTPASKAVVRPKQLENTTCQTGGNTMTETELFTVLAADGASPALVKTETGAGAENASAALKAGASARCGCYCWDGLECKESGVQAGFLFFRDVNEALDDYPLLLAAGNTFLQKQPQQVHSFLKAAKLGYLYAAAHPDETAKLLCAAQPDLKSQQALVQRCLTWLAGKYTDDATLWGQLDVQRWNRFYSWMNQKKLTTKAVPLSIGFTNSYLPQS